MNAFTITFSWLFATSWLSYQNWHYNQGSCEGKFCQSMYWNPIEQTTHSYGNSLGDTIFVEYEGLYQICFRCRKYRHRQEGCTWEGAPLCVPMAWQQTFGDQSSLGDQGFSGPIGPWMLSNLGRRRKTIWVTSRWKLGRLPIGLPN